MDRCKGSRRDEGVEKGLKEREKEWQKEDEGREMVELLMCSRLSFPDNWRNSNTSKQLSLRMCRRPRMTFGWLRSVSVVNQSISHPPTSRHWRTCRPRSNNWCELTWYPLLLGIHCAVHVSQTLAM